MSNVVEFKPRQKSSPQPVVKVGDEVQLVAVSAPVLEGEDLRPRVVTIEDTASVQAVQALMFYARQGWDGGDKAKKALIAMNTVLSSREASPAIQ